MGWDYGQKPLSPKAYLDRNCTWTGVLHDMRVLRSAFVGLTYYAAVQRVNMLTGDREVFAVVSLIRYTRDGEMGKKDMDESMGPIESRCPRTILELLTPTDDETANRWRARCWRNAEKVNPADVAQWARETRGADYFAMSTRYKRLWTNAYKRFRATQPI